MIPAEYTLFLSVALFSIGILGMATRRNLIVVLMAVELILNAANLAFITFARQLDSLDGMMMTFFTIVIAAPEVVVGLSIILAIYRKLHDLNIENLTLLSEKYE